MVNPPKSVLTIMAHPDDAELWAGGYLAQCVHIGAQVTIALPRHGPERDAEAEAGAVVLGTQLRLLEDADSTCLAALLKKERPEVVITHPVRVVRRPAKAVRLSLEQHHLLHRAVVAQILERPNPSRRHQYRCCSPQPRLAASGHSPLFTRMRNTGLTQAQGFTPVQMFRPPLASQEASSASLSSIPLTCEKQLKDHCSVSDWT